MHEWNSPVFAHRFGLRRHEATDYERTDARLSVASLNDPRMPF